MDTLIKDNLKTVDRIDQIAFRYFLEKGYEATNLRIISEEVGMKAASLYFYYKSKSDLFMHILNKTFERQLLITHQSLELYKDAKPKEKLYFLFRDKILDGMTNSVEYKFRLRYRMFPTEELSEEIRMTFEEWNEKEFIVYSPIINACLEGTEKAEEINDKVIYYQYTRFMFSIIYERIISGLSIKEKEISTLWKHFADSLLNET